MFVCETKCFVVFSWTYILVVASKYKFDTSRSLVRT